MTGILSKIAKALKGNSCERLVKQTKNEYKIKGIDFGIGDYKITVGEFENKIKKFYRVTNTMVSLDNTQYLLCTTMHMDITSKSLQDTCNRIRLQIIIGFNQLEALLGSISQKSTKELKNNLEEWVDYMNDVSKKSIEILSPTKPKDKVKAKRKPLPPKPRMEYITESFDPAFKRPSGKKKDSFETFLDKLMKYQGIKKNEMKDAMKILESNN